MTTGYQYDGDPKIIITESGADIEFRGGQPVMDRGLENAAIISLFTESGWVGNAFLKGRGESIGSDFEKVSKDVAVTASSFEAKAQAARQALAWMVSVGLAGKIETSWQNPTGNALVLVPVIFPPGNGKATSLLLTKNGPNWMTQKKDPAYNRITEA